MHTLSIDTSDCGKDVCVKRGVSDEFDDRASISRTVDLVKEKGEVSIRTGEVMDDGDEENVERQETERTIVRKAESRLSVCQLITENGRYHEGDNTRRAGWALGDFSAYQLTNSGDGEEYLVSIQ